MSLQIGKLYLYNTSKSDKKIYKLVLITDGQYYGSSGGISNFWEFSYINPHSGMLSGKTGCDYDNRDEGFIEIDSILYNIQFNLNTFWNKYYLNNKAQIIKRKKSI